VKNPATTTKKSRRESNKQNNNNNKEHQKYNIKKQYQTLLPVDLQPTRPSPPHVAITQTQAGETKETTNHENKKE
jgi:hypothetical protein